MKANSIIEVIQQLDSIIADCRKTSSRLGYFACLYRNMTIAVQSGIETHLFEDGPRMEKLDVCFANRYLAAYNAYTSGQKPTAAWQKAFDAAASNQFIVLQHLLLGINAHINLDLGIAAAEISKGGDIQALANDFNKINDIISNLSGEVQKDLESISWPMKFLNNIRQEKAVINFSITIARKAAWTNALALSAIPVNQQENYIVTLDTQIAAIAQKIISPGFFVSLLLRSIRLFENANINKNIDFLYN